MCSVQTFLCSYLKFTLPHKVPHVYLQCTVLAGSHSSLLLSFSTVSLALSLSFALSSPSNNRLETLCDSLSSSLWFLLPACLRCLHACPYISNSSVSNMDAEENNKLSPPNLKKTKSCCKVLKTVFPLRRDVIYFTPSPHQLSIPYFPDHKSLLFSPTL